MPSDLESDNEMEQPAYGEDETESLIVEYLVGSPDIGNDGYLHDIQLPTDDQRLENSDNKIIHYLEKSQSPLSLEEDETSILTTYEFPGALSTVEEPATENSEISEYLDSMSPIQADQYFDEAFHFREEFQQLEDEASERPSLSPTDMIEHYLSLACSSSSRFRLLHEYSLPHELLEETSEKPQVLLLPLLCGKPLTPRLIHSLLY